MSIKLGHDRGRVRRISIAIDTDLADWLDARAKERNLGREHLVETALMLLRAGYDKPQGED